MSSFLQLTPYLHRQEASSGDIKTCPGGIEISSGGLSIPPGPPAPRGFQAEEDEESLIESGPVQDPAMGETIDDIPDYSDSDEDDESKLPETDKTKHPGAWMRDQPMPIYVDGTCLYLPYGFVAKYPFWRAMARWSTKDDRDEFGGYSVDVFTLMIDVVVRRGNIVEEMSSYNLTRLMAAWHAMDYACMHEDMIFVFHAMANYLDRKQYRGNKPCFDAEGNATEGRTVEASIGIFEEIFDSWILFRSVPFYKKGLKHRFFSLLVLTLIPRAHIDTIMEDVRYHVRNDFIGLINKTSAQVNHNGGVYKNWEYLRRLAFVNAYNQDLSKIPV